MDLGIIIAHWRGTHRFARATGPDAGLSARVPSGGALRRQ